MHREPIRDHRSTCPALDRLSAAHLDAIKAAGLAERVAIDTLARKEKPPAEQLPGRGADGHTVPPGLLPAMPKLRCVQAMTRASRAGSPCRPAARR